MTSDELKYAVLWNWRFKQRAKYLATEMFAQTQNIRDVLIIDRSNYLIEVECKVSNADFKADFKKQKHLKGFFYDTGIGCDMKWIPRPMFFYFAFPDYVEFDKTLLDEYPKYGILRVSKSKRNAMLPGERCPYHVSFEKGAGMLTEKNDKAFREEYCAKIIPQFVLRMSSEIVNLHGRICCE